MSQNSLVIADGTGVEVLAAVNAALDTLNTLHAGTSAPATPTAEQLWVDTTNNLLKIYHGATWVTLGSLAANLGMLPTAGGTMTGDLVLSGATTDISVGGNATVTGTLGVTGAATLSSTLGVTGAMTLSNVMNGAKGANITAAATTDLATATGNYVDVNNASGTTTITDLDTANTLAAGAWRLVRFSITGGSVTLTHNATSLILPGGQSISVTDGDCALFVCLGSGNWRCLIYQRNSLAARIWSVVAKSDNYTVTTSDYGAYFIFTQTTNKTLTLPAASTAGSGFIFGISNRGTAGTKITIDGNASETIDGLTTQDLYPGSATAYICNGTAWYRMETGVTADAPSYANNITINASGTWIVPAGVYQARFTVIGGGGGGAGSGSTGTAGGTGGSASVTGTAGTLTGNGGGGGGVAGAASGAGGTGVGGTTNITGGVGGAGYAGVGGGGGSGGGFAQKIMSVTPGDTYTITINAAGTAGAGGGTPGTATGGGGGASAAGQSGGANNGEPANGYGGAGGAGSGTAGAVRNTSSTGGLSASVSTGKESAGGASGGYASSTTGNPGGIGVGAGSGGGGGASGSGGNASGGAGGTGRVYIEW